jgi:hypothetical protein
VNYFPHVSAIRCADRPDGARNQSKWFGRAQVASSNIAALAQSVSELIGVIDYAFDD